MSLDTIILIIAAVLSLPGGLFAVSLMSQPRTRWRSLIAGIIGAVLTALAVKYFIHVTDVTTEAVSWFLGSFLACSMGVAVAALLVNWFANLDRRSAVSPLES